LSHDKSSLDFSSPYAAVKEAAQLRKRVDELEAEVRDYATKLGEAEGRVSVWMKKCELAQKRADAAEDGAREWKRLYEDERRGDT
jgi:hypothetical protein